LKISGKLPLIIGGGVARVPYEELQVVIKPSVIQELLNTKMLLSGYDLWVRRRLRAPGIHAGPVPVGCEVAVIDNIMHLPGLWKFETRSIGAHCFHNLKGTPLLRVKLGLDASNVTGEGVMIKELV
jgi:hypothetical protein